MLSTKEMNVGAFPEFLESAVNFRMWTCGAHQDERPFRMLASELEKQVPIDLPFERSHVPDAGMRNGRKIAGFGKRLRVGFKINAAGKIRGMRIDFPLFFVESR